MEIISQQEEANLFYKAVLGDFQTDEDFTILDMGGGSAQVLIGNRCELGQALFGTNSQEKIPDQTTQRAIK